MSIIVTQTTCRQPLGDSGCDEVVEVRVWYKRQSSTTGGWSYTEAASVNETALTIDYLTIEQYEVKVSVTNNKDFVSNSKVVTADFQKCTSYFNVLIFLL